MKRAKQPTKRVVRVENCELVFDGRVFSVTRDAAVAPNGVRVVREVVRHAGSAVIIPRRADGRILLLRQFRLPMLRDLWELAAGRLDAGEKPLDAARRELSEETGFSAARWTLLAQFYPSPGFLDERMSLFLAEDLSAGRAHPEPDEVIKRHWVTMARMGEMVRSGKIEDAKTLLGYFLLAASRKTR